MSCDRNLSAGPRPKNHPQRASKPARLWPLVLVAFAISLFTHSATASVLKATSAYSRIQQHLPSHTLSQAWLYIQLSTQTLFKMRGREIAASYPISSGAAGEGTEADSWKTPPGLHRVKHRIGDGVPLGGILKARAYTGQTAEIFRDAYRRAPDHVTTRILWLEGLESGVNRGLSPDGRVVDSYRRHIYIHGTAEEGLIGQKASKGCIRMRNQDVLALYESVPAGTLVLIDGSAGRHGELQRHDSISEDEQ